MRAVSDSLRRSLRLAAAVAVAVGVPACAARRPVPVGGGAVTAVTFEAPLGTDPGPPLRRSAPHTTWPHAPRLHKEGTNDWRLQGTQHWEGLGDEYRDLFLEQRLTITQVLRERDAQGASRVVGSTVLEVVEVFPCLQGGSTAMREVNDIHDFRLDLKGSCAGDVWVDGRLALGTLRARGIPGTPGERVTQGAQAQAFRYHVLSSTFKVRGHDLDDAFAFEPVTPPTWTSYAFHWDECAGAPKRGDGPDRLAAGGVEERDRYR